MDSFRGVNRNPFKPSKYANIKKYDNTWKKPFIKITTVLAMQA